MVDLTLGLLGLGCLVLAWIPQTLDILRTKTNKMNPNFGLLYLAGSALLTYYSWLINDYLFMALNGLTAILSTVNFYYSLQTINRKTAARAKPAKTSAAKKKAGRRK